MIETLLEIFIVACGIVFLIGSVMGLREWFQIRQVANLTLSQLPVKKTIFCQLVIDWCHQNMAHPNTRKPSLTVKYYHHKKLSGVYFSSYHECVIYVNSHNNIRQVTNTVIHEYVHARQKNKHFDKMYDKFQKEVGYNLNPFELEARELAKQHENQALLWVCRQIAI